MTTAVDVVKVNIRNEPRRRRPTRSAFLGPSPPPPFLSPFPQQQRQQHTCFHLERLALDQVYNDPRAQRRVRAARRAPTRCRCIEINHCSMGRTRIPAHTHASVRAYSAGSNAADGHGAETFLDSCSAYLLGSPPFPYSHPRIEASEKRNDKFRAFEPREPRQAVK